MRTVEQAAQHKEANRRWFLANREKVLAKQIAYTVANKAAAKEATRQWKKDHPVETAAYNAKWRALNKEKHAAHWTVDNALRNGQLVKQPCYCGETKVDAHHEDYDKPLDVMWLCRKHHHARHVELRKQAACA